MSSPSASNAQFVGSIPELYDRHLGPVFFEPYAADLCARLAPAPAMKVLEIACGTGIVTRRLLGRLSADAVLVATDLNEPMLAHAKAGTTADARVTWQAADAQNLPFSDHHFDAIVCQFGVMFVPDKALAFREMRRVLVPGGQLLFNVWDSFAANPGARLFHEEITALFPTNPPEFMHVPFGWSDQQIIRDTVAGAGFSDVALHVVVKDAESKSARDWAIGLVRGNPIALAIGERGTLSLEAVVDKITTTFAKTFGEAPCRTTMSAIVVSARA